MVSLNKALKRIEEAIIANIVSLEKFLDVYLRLDLIGEEPGEK